MTKVGRGKVSAALAVPLSEVGATASTCAAAEAAGLVEVRASRGKAWIALKKSAASVVTSASGREDTTASGALGLLVAVCGVAGAGNTVRTTASWLLLTGCDCGTGTGVGGVLFLGWFVPAAAALTTLAVAVVGVIAVASLSPRRVCGTPRSWLCLKPAMAPSRPLTSGLADRAGVVSAAACSTDDFAIRLIEAPFCVSVLRRAAAADAAGKPAALICGTSVAAVEARMSAVGGRGGAGGTPVCSGVVDVSAGAAAGGSAGAGC